MKLLKEIRKTIADGDEKTLAHIEEVKKTYVSTSQLELMLGRIEDAQKVTNDNLAKCTHEVNVAHERTDEVLSTLSNIKLCQCNNS